MIKDEKEKRALDSIFHNTKPYNTAEDNTNYTIISDALDEKALLKEKLAELKAHVEKRLAEENEFPEYNPEDEEKYWREYWWGFGAYHAFKEIIDLINKEK